jgi:hypothetical protein
MPINILEKLEAAGALISEANLLDNVELLYATGKLATFTGIHTSARHLATRLREQGVRPRTFELPADGNTVFGDWRMPRGWECSAGLLEIIDPFELRHKVLAERKKVSACVAIGSAATPDTGITAAIAKIASVDELKSKAPALRGKFAFIAEHPRSYIAGAIASGAVGIISSWCSQAHHLPEATAWVELDDSNPDAPKLPVMMISPETGVELDVLLDRGAVRLRMLTTCHSSASTLPIVCGYIDAELQEEVLALTPYTDPGANTGAAGAAALIEALRALQEAVANKKLEPLRRGIRALFTHRNAGTIGFAAQNPGILRRVMAGISLDSIGRQQESCEAQVKLFATPDVSASVADTLFAMLVETGLRRFLPYAKAGAAPCELSDNVYCDPRINVPTPAAHGSDRFGATSSDTPDNLFSGRALHAWSAITLAYLHILSTATAKEAHWLAHESLNRYAQRIGRTAAKYALELEAWHGHEPPSQEERARILTRAYLHLAYIRETAERAAMSAKSFMLREERATGHLALLKQVRHLRRLADLEKRRIKELAGCEPVTVEALPAEFSDIAALRPYRIFLGTPAYDNIPAGEWAGIGSPRNLRPLHLAFYWSDGEHTFEEIVRRVEFELSDTQAPDAPSVAPDVAAILAPHFRLMAKHGMMRMLTPGESVPKPHKPVRHEEPSEPPTSEPAESEVAS